MQITSPLFLFLFLPLALVFARIGPQIMRSWVLLLFSCVFYLWGEPEFAWIIGLFILFNHAAALFIQRGEGRVAEFAFWCAVIVNLALLGWFKYLVFAFETRQTIFGFSDALSELSPGHLPLGVSFFVFLAISYLADVRNGVCEASRSLRETTLFFWFFPKVVAGPLTRFGDFSPAPSAPCFSEDFAEGVRRFIIGLARKVLIATPLMKGADQIMNAPVTSLDMATSWLGAILYSLQIYHDFAGYTDMAIGLGIMFGYRIGENFNFPYSSLSFTDFWRRWHITLSSWIRDYLFYPVSRALITEGFREKLSAGKATMLPRICVTLCCVFTICGLWHGAGWNFVIWGLAHGLFLSFEQTVLGKRLGKAPVYFRRLYLLVFLVLMWVLFRLESVDHIVGYFTAMFVPLRSPAAPAVMNPELLLVLFIALIFSFPFMERLTPLLPAPVPRYLRDGCYLFIFGLTLMAVASGAFQPFVYARF